MMITIALRQLAAGFSIALVIFALAVLWTNLKTLPVPLRPVVAERARLLNGTGWTLMALAVLVYRPLHTGWLLGHKAPAVLSSFGDMSASALGCAAFILLLAARALMRGATDSQANNGVWINLVIAFGCVGATWLAG